MGSKVRLIKEETAGMRIALGLTYVEKSLADRGFQVVWQDMSGLADSGTGEGDAGSAVPGNAAGRRVLEIPGEESPACSIYVGVRGESGYIRQLEEEGLLLYHTKAPCGEGFYLAYLPGLRLAVVAGGTDTGALYGALELAERIGRESSSNAVPTGLRGRPGIPSQGPCGRAAAHQGGAAQAHL